MTAQCDHATARGYRCPFTAIVIYEGQNLCERHYWKASRDVRTPDMCTHSAKGDSTCRQTAARDGLCVQHFEMEHGEGRQMVVFAKWLDAIFAGGELWCGRDADVEHCPLCGFMAYVVHDAIENRCTFCGYQWPFDKKERDEVEREALSNNR